jgi:hypothetical protein
LVQFLFNREMSGKPFELVAILPEPGAITSLPGERKVLTPNYLRHADNRFVSVDPAVLIYEPLVVY